MFPRSAAKFNFKVGVTIFVQNAEKAILYQLNSHNNDTQ
jgi:hypothetical protein